MKSIESSENLLPGWSEFEASMFPARPVSTIRNHMSCGSWLDRDRYADTVCITCNGKDLVLMQPSQSLERCSEIFT